MKPKETQVLGLLITILIALITFDLYTIYCITNYIKLTSLDVTTSFAVVDALFYQSIKLIILSYGIFALSVEIRGIYILRERRNNKLISFTKRNNITEPTVVKFEGNVNTDNDYVVSLQDLANEAKIQEKSSNLEFERTYTENCFDKYNIDRYGYKALLSLTRDSYLNLLHVNRDFKIKTLYSLNDYYTKLNPITKEEEKCWDRVVYDLTQLKIK